MTPPAAPAPALAAAALALARAFHDGATLWCWCPTATSHARHLAVEFLHPVIVGKRALPAIAVGDWVLVHVGFAMAKIDEEEAASTLAFIKELGSVYDEELDSLRGEGVEPA